MPKHIPRIIPITTAIFTPPPSLLVSSVQRHVQYKISVTYQWLVKEWLILLGLNLLSQ